MNFFDILVQSRKTEFMLYLFFCFAGKEWSAFSVLGAENGAGYYFARGACHRKI